MALPSKIRNLTSGFIGCRVAFVDRGLVNRSVQELIAMRARDQGIIAAVFGDEGQALNWLRHGID